MAHSRADDLELLNILDLHERQGLTAAQVAERMGGSRSSILGKVHRVRCDADATPCHAARPENQDGGMPERWWAR